MMMTRFAVRLIAASWLVFTLVGDAHAVRIATNPSTAFGDPALQFDNIALTPDGNTIVATGLFNGALTSDRLYSLTIPADPATQTAAITQISSNQFTVTKPNYDVAFAPVISPDGQTILYTQDGNTFLKNTIYTMPIAGELTAANYTGLFGANPNLVSPGDGSSSPVYSADGSTIFFINNNAGFDGATIPIFTSSPSSYDPRPDWDRLYSVPAAGGTPTAVTAPGDGDIDAGLFALTPNGSSVVYAPDNPVAEGTDRGGNRPKLFSISTAGGASTEISIPAPAHDFTFARQLEVTSDGQNVLFIADYDALGKHELYSVPIAGGTPTRISDDLPWSGDVSSFALAPNGTQVAYVAGQNTGANSELFLTPVTGGTGNSIRVSDPASTNSGEFDVSTSVEGGQIAFSNDSSQIYYLGDFETAEVRDLYVVDTTEKTGLIPSPFTFVGATGGDFFDENNWEDADGNNAPAGTIDAGVPIRHSLIIDGDTVGTSGGEADFQVGGSLELTAGSVLNFPSAGDELDFNPGSGLKITDATISVFEDIFLEGDNFLTGGLIESTGDDIEFQDGHNSTIDGTTFRSAVDNILFDNSVTSVTGATFESADRFGMRFEVDITVTDTDINVRGFSSSHPAGDGYGDVEDAFSGAQGEGSTLTLEGASTLLANAIQDGVALVLDGTSVATLLADPGGHADDPVDGFDLVDSNGTITFMSAGAKMITLHASASDVRALIINGLTGMSYLDDPTAWNVTNWDGMSPLASLQLVGVGPAGDFDNDGDVDGADFLVWQRGLGTIFTATDLNDWKANYGTGASSALASATSVPEPTSALLIFTACCLCGMYRKAHII